MHLLELQIPELVEQRVALLLNPQKLERRQSLLYQPTFLLQVNFLNRQHYLRHPVQLIFLQMQRWHKLQEL